VASDNPLKLIPSVDRLLKAAELQDVLTEFGHQAATGVVRELLDSLRAQIKKNPSLTIPDTAEIAAEAIIRLKRTDSASLVSVLNLTGTVLHTNLGRAQLPESALEAVTRIASGNSNLEFDLDKGKRGDRDHHVENLLAELTGAEAVTVVNNNAAAVLLCLNTLAARSTVCISRGELVEIGGSFRIPEVMEKSNCALREVGATNRTHLKDYAQAIDDNTALLMKVHTSNYEIRGFTQEVTYEALSGLAKEHSLPLLADLGSGTLVDLERYGLAHEPTVQEVLAAGADLVTFSGDKLLGGPQAGIIAGNAALVERVKNNPLKRALRVDKMTMAALHEVLKLYRNPETVGEALPTLRHLSRSRESILAVAEGVLPIIAAALEGHAQVRVVETHSQIGSGALPLDQLPSAAIELTPLDSSDSALRKLADTFRELPLPVIGRLQDGRMLLDLRTLDDPDSLTGQLDKLHIQ
jgi:L-seryl-tRNA(Ser) seleniumtransferase